MRSAAFLLLSLTAAACPPKKDVAPTHLPPPEPAPAVPSPFAQQPAGKRVAVLYTASVQGYVEPCGCTGDPLGGIARLGAALDDARRAYDGRVLFLDGGDLLFEHLSDTSPTDLCQAEARVDLLVSSYAAFGLAGTVLGPLDDVRGAAFRDTRLAAHKLTTLGVGLPRPLASPHATSIVKELGPAKIGVSAFRVDDAARADAVHEELLAEIEKLMQQNVDAVIVLAQAPRELTTRVVTNIPGVDVVIQGRAPGEAPNPPEQIEGGPIIVASGQQAQHVGVLELVLDGRKAGEPLALDDRASQVASRSKLLEVRIAALKQQVNDTPEGPKKQFLVERLTAAEAELASLKSSNADAPLLEPHVVARAVPLPRGFREEPKAAGRLASYQASIPSLVEKCEAGAVCEPAKEGQATWVGALECKKCHAAAYGFWMNQTVKLPGKDEQGRAIVRDVGHARAWTTLVEDKKDRDRSCVGCHSVGFEEPGGPCKTSEIVKRGLEGVQCESCHGPGSIHVKTGKAADLQRVDEARCRTCHVVPHIPTTESFVLDDKLKLILGPGHGEKKWRGLLAPGSALK